MSEQHPSFKAGFELARKYIVDKISEKEAQAYMMAITRTLSDERQYDLTEILRGRSEGTKHFKGGQNG